MQSQTLNFVGMIFNTAAAVVLIIPNLTATRDIEDDLIVSAPGGGKYTQKKHLRSLRLNLVGFALLLIGFALQLGGTFMSDPKSRLEGGGVWRDTHLYRCLTPKGQISSYLRRIDRGGLRFKVVTCVPLVSDTGILSAAIRRRA